MMQRRIIVSPTDKVGTYSSDNRGKQNKKHTIEEYVPPKPKIDLQGDDHDFVPLELLPTIRTLRGYGRRMNALGALRTCRALEKVIDHITPHLGKYPELVDVIAAAQLEAADIRATAFREASGEQDDGDSLDHP